MTENKTKATEENVTVFINKIPDTQLRNDCYSILEMMETVSKTKPVMWGSSIIGFGKRHYVYESGREGDTVVIGFSPRKQNISLYLAGGLTPLEGELAKLGKHKTSKGCLYIKSFSDINAGVLKKILTKSYNSGKQK